MRQFVGFATMGMAIALMPAAFGQTQPGAQAAPQGQPQAEAQVRVIPPDDQASKEQLAKLFDVMQLRQQMASMTKTLPAMMQQQISQQIKSMATSSSGSSLTPEQQAAVATLMKKYMEKAMSLYPADEMIADLSGIYQRHLSREDVESVIAFYSSPAGQHMLELSPAVMKEYVPLVMSRMQERSKALTDEMKKDMKDTVPGWVPPANGPAAN
jgi:hypothetical protein